MNYEYDVAESDHPWGAAGGGEEEPHPLLLLPAQHTGLHHGLLSGAVELSDMQTWDKSVFTRRQHLSSRITTVLVL